MQWMRTLFLIASISYTPSIALSYNLGFLHDTATTSFDSTDWKLMDAATDKALTLPNGKKAHWKNHDTGHEGYAQPLNRVDEKGTLCRSVRIVNHAGHRKDHYIFQFCKFSNGWKIAR